jgi:hypothetical protein
MLVAPSLEELGLNSQVVKTLASMFHVHSANFAAQLVHTKRALSSTVFYSHLELCVCQAYDPLT